MARSDPKSTSTRINLARTDSLNRESMVFDHPQLVSDKHISEREYPTDHIPGNGNLRVG